MSLSNINWGVVPMSKFYLDIFYGMNIKQETGSVAPSRSSAMFNGISEDWLRCLVFTEVDIIFQGCIMLSCKA